MFVLEARKPRDLIAVGQLWLRLFGERDEVLEVAAARLVALAQCRQSLERILAHDLEHREPRVAGGSLALPDEALVDQRRESFQHGVVSSADSLGGRKRPAAREHAELREEALRSRLEQVVAPVERHAERLLMLRRVATTAGEEFQPVTQA